MQVRPTEFISASTQHTCGADGIHLTTNSRDGRRREEEIKPNKKEAGSSSLSETERNNAPNTTAQRVAKVTGDYDSRDTRDNADEILRHRTN